MPAWKLRPPQGSDPSHACGRGAQQAPLPGTVCACLSPLRPCHTFLQPILQMGKWRLREVQPHPPQVPCGRAGIYTQGWLLPCCRWVPRHSHLRAAVCVEGSHTGGVREQPEVLGVGRDVGPSRHQAQVPQLVGCDAGEPLQQRTHLGWLGAGPAARRGPVSSRLRFTDEEAEKGFGGAEFWLRVTEDSPWTNPVAASAVTPGHSPLLGWATGLAVFVGKGNHLEA